MPKVVYLKGNCARNKRGRVVLNPSWLTVQGAIGICTQLIPVQETLTKLPTLRLTGSFLLKGGVRMEDGKRADKLLKVHNLILFDVK